METIASQFRRNIFLPRFLTSRLFHMIDCSFLFLSNHLKCEKLLHVIVPQISHCVNGHWAGKTGSPKRESAGFPGFKEKG